MKNFRIGPLQTIRIYDSERLEDNKALRHTMRQVTKLRAAKRGIVSELHAAKEQEKALRAKLRDRLCCNGVAVSDHAVVRYLERVKGVDIQAVVEEIAKQIPEGSLHGRFEIEGGEARVADGIVQTVVVYDD